MRRAVAVVAVAVLVSGCSGLPDLTQPSPAASVAGECVEVMASLPRQVMGQDRTLVDGFIATWGDPRISLRCGVEPPANLTRTSHCDELNGVGWFSEEPGEAIKGAWRFTTLGRSGFIEVVVPEEYEPAGDVLIDLTDSVGAMTLVTPCA